MTYDNGWHLRPEPIPKVPIPNPLDRSSRRIAEIERKRLEDLSNGVPSHEAEREASIETSKIMWENSMWVREFDVCLRAVLRTIENQGGPEEFLRQNPGGAESEE